MEAAQVADLYLPLCLAGPRYVFAQLGQSLDGCIASRTGDACFVTGEDDRRHLHRLRALADAVIVGAGTALADDPQLTVRAVPGTNPVRVVLDPRGRVPSDGKMFTDEAASTLWLLDRDAPSPPSLPPQVEIVRLRAGRTARIAPRQVLDALAARGLGRVLVEGGGVTVSRFLAERALHRLYLTVAPVLVGDGVRGVRFPGETLMRDAVRPPTRRFDLGDDVLFELDLSARSRAREMPAIVD
jgi:riboflavin-specific deaminase-like protein